MNDTLRVGIFGATGAVGREMMNVLHDRAFPLTELRIFASANSAGKKIPTPFGHKTVEDANKADFSTLDLALFAISGAWSKENAQKAIEGGCKVIDNSSAFRYHDNIPLVIPEINGYAIQNAPFIANPNCTTAIAAIPIHVLHQHYGLKRVLISTYQAASGAGEKGMQELREGTRAYLASEPVVNKVFAHPLPFNLIPHIDEFQGNGYTKEEMKVVWELSKILDLHELPISCTAVRIPTLRAHSETIVVETERYADPKEVRKLFANTPGILVKDNPAEKVYPMPLTASGKYEVEVGRIRKSLVFDHGVEFFVCGDQLLRGAALNAVLIAEKMYEKR